MDQYDFYRLQNCTQSLSCRSSIMHNILRNAQHFWNSHFSSMNRPFCSFWMKHVFKHMFWRLLVVQVAVSFTDYQRKCSEKVEIGLILS